MGKVITIDVDEATKLAEVAKKNLQEAEQEASIVVCNQFGELMASVRMDGVRSFTLNVATIKAKQAGYTGQSTRELRDKIACGEISYEILGIPKDSFIKWAGGVPIYTRKGNLIGGLGISNLSEDEDEEFALAALEKCNFKARR